MFPILFIEYSGKNIPEFIYSSCSIGLLKGEKRSNGQFFGQHLELMHFDTNLTEDIAFWSQLQNSNLFQRGKKNVLRRMDTGNRFYFEF